MAATIAPAPDLVASRIARLLRPAAVGKGAWVSTEAGVRQTGGAVLRPAVMVARGALPYDGIVDDPPLLVIETGPAQVARWYDACARAVWGSAGDTAVVLARGGRRQVARTKHLTVPGHPWLRLPAAELLRPASVGNLIHLPR